MKIEINIEKKHLLFFSIFIILISSFIVLGNYETFGHSANEVGPGQMAGPISVEVTQGFSGNAFSARTSSGDAIKGETYMDGKSAIYGYVSSGVNAFSGFFEGGPLVLFNQIFSILNSNGEEAYIYNDENGNMILGDEFSGDGYTLSELAQGGSSGESYWEECNGGICYDENLFVKGRIITERGTYGNGLIWCSEGINDVTSLDFKCNSPIVYSFSGPYYHNSNPLYAGNSNENEGAAACFALGARYGGVNVAVENSNTFVVKLDSTELKWIGATDKKSEYIKCDFI